MSIEVIKDKMQLISLLAKECANAGWYQERNDLINQIYKLLSQAEQENRQHEAGDR